jgi:uncharacterized protein
VLVSVGLLGLLDDVVGLAKLAAASVDDTATLAARASAKAAGVVIDDAAVTPRYVVGFAAARELPIVKRIAWGSLKNKLLYLLPAAIALSLLAPWAITPLLMLGGLYLCYEGAERVIEAFWPHHAPAAAQGGGPLAAATPEAALAEEERRVKGAIRTDLILSAEIMAITLASVADAALVTRVLVLAVVGVGITVVVYGAVALIVKADDAGVALAASGRPVLAPLGRAIVRAMPPFLKLLSVVGTAAMLWVGGGIVLHGIEGYGLAGPAHAIHHAAEVVGHAVGRIGPAVGWLVAAAAAGVFGFVLGALAVPVVQRVAPSAAH